MSTFVRIFLENLLLLELFIQNFSNSLLHSITHILLDTLVSNTYSVCSLLPKYLTTTYMYILYSIFEFIEQSWIRVFSSFYLKVNVRIFRIFQSSIRNSFQLKSLRYGMPCLPRSLLGWYDIHNQMTSVLTMIKGDNTYWGGTIPVEW